MTIETLFDGQTDRYAFDWDACHCSKGWAQVDTKQDASYFGTWANPIKRQIVCYCEGDITVEKCATDEEFVVAIRKLEEWNRKMGFWVGVDGMCSERIISRFTDLGLSDLLH